MDQTKHQINLQTLSQFIKSQFIKKVTQLLFSVSVFSFLFSKSSWFSFFLHSFNFYFSKPPFKLFSYTIDRSCIFLICNGILVFLAKNSGLISSSPSASDLNDEYFKKNDDGLQSASVVLPETKASILLDKKVVVESSDESLETDIVVEKRENDQYLIHEGEREIEKNLIAEDEEEEETRSSVHEDENNEEEDEEEEEEEGNGLLSTEELNRKFDDFIRRMKEEIRIQQLVMV